MYNLASVLEFASRDFPDNTALVFQHIRMTYSEVNRLASQIANGLADFGIGKGDRVALTCPNIPHFAVIYYGILKTGATVVPLNILFTERQIAFHLRDCGAKAYFCFEGENSGKSMATSGYSAFQTVQTCRKFWIATLDPKAKSPIENVPAVSDLATGRPFEFETVFGSSEDTAVIMYTSGTTGIPLGAELSHVNVLNTALITREMASITSEDVQLVVLPLSQSFAQIGQMNTGFLAGTTLVLLNGFDPEEVGRSLENENVTVVCGVPTMYWEILNYSGLAQFNVKKIVSQMRLGISGGAVMPSTILKNFEEKFKTPILEGYGMSETCFGVTFNHPNRRKKRSVGTPIWGTNIRLIDENGDEAEVRKPGEILVQGLGVMKGYYNKPYRTERVLKDGWFHTGDYGWLDEDGYLYLLDREEDIILRNGVEIYPRIVEEVLMRHPAVSMAAVVGKPDEELGEEIAAFIVLFDGHNPEAAEIVEWSREKMPDDRYPRIIEFGRNLPMTVNGKISKKELRAMLKMGVSFELFEGGRPVGKA